MTELRSRYQRDLFSFARAMRISVTPSLGHHLNSIMAQDHMIGTTWKEFKLAEARNFQQTVILWRMLMFNDCQGLLVCCTQREAEAWFTALRELLHYANQDVRALVEVGADWAAVRGGYPTKRPSVRWTTPFVPESFGGWVSKHLTFVVPNIDRVPTDSVKALVEASKKEGHLMVGHLPRKK